MGKDLLEFHPRVTSSEQVTEVVVRGWDYKKKEAAGRPRAGERLVAPRSRPSRPSSPGRSGSRRYVVVDRTLSTQAAVDAAGAFDVGSHRERLRGGAGPGRGNPKLKAGVAVSVRRRRRSVRRQVRHHQHAPRLRPGRLPDRASPCPDARTARSSGWRAAARAAPDRRRHGSTAWSSRSSPATTTLTTSAGSSSSSRGWPTTTSPTGRAVVRSARGRDRGAGLPAGGRTTRSWSRSSSATSADRTWSAGCGTGSTSRASATTCSTTARSSGAGSCRARAIGSPSSTVTAMPGIALITSDDKLKIALKETRCRDPRQVATGRS